MSRRAGRLRTAARILATALALLALAVAALLWAMHRSLPRLDGALRLEGLQAPASVERDARGTVVVRAADRLDAARALGFVHAQERFFEMDVTRRSAAGELSGLFGAAALGHDKLRRAHRLRTRLAARLEAMSPSERALLQAYADGVNAGLDALPVRPWPYLLLRAEPRAWSPVDSLLVVSEMFWMLQGAGVDAGLDRARLRAGVGDALFDWLEPRGGRWDAALDGSTTPAVPLPGPALIDLRAASAPRASPAPERRADAGALLEADDVHAPATGSNEWAVAGARGAGGAALLANDMHLGLGVPALWLRAQLEIGGGEGVEAVRAAGVTLPGLPALVVGSNGRVAWGFTNAYGQWFDWIEIPYDVSSPAARADPLLRHLTETLAVKGGADVTLDVLEWDGLPVVQRDGRAYALRWIADDGDAYNLALDELLGARDVDAAVAIAQRAGMPQQNVVVADAAGHVAWTIAGRLWAGDRGARFGRFAPRDALPPAWLAPAGYPLVKDPPSGLLWTANARQLGGAGGAALGDGGFDLGARAQQIRDRLAALQRADEGALAAIQLDDEARFLQPWARRIARAVAGDPAHAEVARLVAGWNGRADADQAAYRLVRTVRRRTLDVLWRAWTRPALGAMQDDDGRRLEWHAMFEYPAAQALDARAGNLLPRPYADWDEFLRAQVDAVVADMTRRGSRPLAAATWGEANASRLRHLMSRAVPGLGAWLDMPSRPQSGDANLPHVAAPSFGQSERLVVAPGHEDRAILVIAGGQSGHPMSPFYGAGQDDWAAGRREPLLAGPVAHTLRMIP
jgi:penicillin amidase